MSIRLILTILFGISLVVSAIGFRRFLWFISVGYGFSIFCCGFAIIIISLFQNNLNFTGLIACLILMTYGIRLGGFLLIREKKNISYRKALSMDERQQKNYPLITKISIWITVSALYTLQTSGIVFVLNTRNYASFSDFSIVEVLGLALMAFGLILEGKADRQKSICKKVNPGLPAMTGVYKLQRCPNYCGEVLMWTGVVVFSMSAASVFKWWMFIAVFVAYASITYIMLNGAKRMETKHTAAYGNIEEAKRYMEKTPLIILVIFPIYSLKNVRFII